MSGTSIIAKIFISLTLRRHCNFGPGSIQSIRTVCKSVEMLSAIVVPTKSDSYVIFCLQLVSKQ